jgi:hypothetical protein
MYWADYRQGSKKAKVHVGFDPCLSGKTA